MPRSKVLSAFRSLHRARKHVFEGDELALTAGRKKINEEFKKHMHETEIEKVNQLLKVAEDSEKLLKKTVVQGKVRDDGIYEIRISDESQLEKNTMFDPHAQLPVRGRRKKCADSAD